MKSCEEIFISCQCFSHFARQTESYAHNIFVGISCGIEIMNAHANSHHLETALGLALFTSLLAWLGGSFSPRTIISHISAVFFMRQSFVKLMRLLTFWAYNLRCKVVEI